ncbi:MAG: hypothetical protein FWD61_12110 [Phycisphaerales bacterium]|nr:hypothetical protein [Phycisphaerales bacterium]
MATVVNCGWYGRGPNKKNMPKEVNCGFVADDDKKNKEATIPQSVEEIEKAEEVPATKPTAKTKK